MIYLRPNGGIGNMFFEIASIWSLARDNNDELCLLDINSNINHLINDKNRKTAKEYLFFLNRFYNKENITIDKKSIYSFDYIPLEYKNEHQYIGYFQHEEYFKHRRDEILSLFKPSDELNEKINNYEFLFDNISLHVRRGDYVNLNITLDIEYYIKSISNLPKNLKILVFSDDLNWCEKNFFGDRFIFINEIDILSIYIMSKMKYHVISNSTFSWWGSWLCEHKDKVIIYPK